MKKAIFFITVFALCLMPLGVSVAQADEGDTGYPWRNHEGKFDFEFYNLIDNHQQMRLLKNGRLQGFIYVQFTGEEINGIPVARRADCTDPELDCRVGWEVIGVLVDGAKLVQSGPRLWEIDPDSLPSDPAFTHFHWTIGSNGKNPQKPCGLVLYDETAPVTYSGYVFQRTAVTTFYWLGGNPDKEKGRLVMPGLDTHSNIYGIWSKGGGNHEAGGGHEEGGEHEEGGSHEEGGEHDEGGCGGH